MKLLIRPKCLVKYVVTFILILAVLALLPTKARAGAGTGLVAIGAVSAVLIVGSAILFRSLNISELERKDADKYAMSSKSSGALQHEDEGEYRLEVSFLRW